MTVLVCAEDTPRDSTKIAEKLRGRLGPLLNFVRGVQLGLAETFHRRADDSSVAIAGQVVAVVVYDIADAIFDKLVDKVLRAIVKVVYASAARINKIAYSSRGFVSIRINQGPRVKMENRNGSRFLR